MCRIRYNVRHTIYIRDFMTPHTTPTKYVPTPTTDSSPTRTIPHVLSAPIIESPSKEKKSTILDHVLSRYSLQKITTTSWGIKTTKISQIESNTQSARDCCLKNLLHVIMFCHVWINVLDNSISNPEPAIDVDPTRLSKTMFAATEATQQHFSPKKHLARILAGSPPAEQDAANGSSSPEPTPSEAELQLVDDIIQLITRERPIFADKFAGTIEPLVKFLEETTGEKFKSYEIIINKQLNVLWPQVKAINAELPIKQRPTEAELKEIMYITIFGKLVFGETNVLWNKTIAGLPHAFAVYTELDECSNKQTKFLIKSPLKNKNISDEFILPDGAAMGGFKKVKLTAIELTLTSNEMFHLHSKAEQVITVTEIFSEQISENGLITKILKKTFTADEIRLMEQEGYKRLLIFDLNKNIQRPIFIKPYKGKNLDDMLGIVALDKAMTSCKNFNEQVAFTMWQAFIELYIKKNILLHDIKPRNMLITIKNSKVDLHIIDYHDRTTSFFSPLIYFKMQQMKRNLNDVTKELQTLENLQLLANQTSLDSMQSLEQQDMNSSEETTSALISMDDLNQKIAELKIKQELLRAKCEKYTKNDLEQDDHIQNMLFSLCASLIIICNITNKQNFKKIKSFVESLTYTEYLFFMDKVCQKPQRPQDTTQLFIQLKRYKQIAPTTNIILSELLLTAFTSVVTLENIASALDKYFSTPNFSSELTKATASTANASSK